MFGSEQDLEQGLNSKRWRAKRVWLEVRWDSGNAARELIESNVELNGWGDRWADVDQRSSLKRSSNGRRLAFALRTSY